MREKLFNDRHSIITGTGRSGTTALVQLFTFLGFDTGYTEETCMNIDEVAKAGLEYELEEEYTPYLIKSPWFMFDVDESIEHCIQHNIKIDCVIVPIRNLRDAAESRKRIYNYHLELGMDSHEAARQLGSLLPPYDGVLQEAKLASQMYRFFKMMAEYEVPLYCLSFPKLVYDWEHCYNSLQPLLVKHGVTQLDVKRAHAKVMKPEYINTFSIEYDFDIDN